MTTDLRPRFLSHDPCCDSSSMVGKGMDGGYVKSGAHRHLSYLDWGLSVRGPELTACLRVTQRSAQGDFLSTISQDSRAQRKGGRRAASMVSLMSSFLFAAEGWGTQRGKQFLEWGGGGQVRCRLEATPLGLKGYQIIYPVCRPFDRIALTCCSNG